jgi:hypothetical protein
MGTVAVDHDRVDHVVCAAALVRECLRELVTRAEFHAAQHPAADVVASIMSGR